MRAILLTAVFAMVCVVSSQSSSAQVEQLPPIPLNPNNPSVDLFFPNEFDLTHPKIITFHALAVATIPAQDAAGAIKDPTLSIQFDWLDPTLPGGIGLSQVFDKVIPFGTQFPPTPIDLTYTIPFCPERVSLHLSTDGGVTVFEGIFRHICQNDNVVPLPAAAWAGMALMGLMAGRRALRRKAA